ncbi:MAG: 2-hydroxyacid dehydrogenase [Gammaproteobacteria bacterium]|nr:2-hydroxyacid dehydrogenase [Gammaproteobacteria bacterium]
MEIVFHYDTGTVLANRLADLSSGGLSISHCTENDDAGFGRLMAEAEVLWHVLKPVTAEVIANAPNLKLIQKIGVGVNTIDLKAAKRRGVRVANMPGTNSRAVAEMTLLLMLGALRCASLLDSACRRGEGWRLDAGVQDRLAELGGRTVGLIGYGAVPRTLAPMLQAMGARILYTAQGKHRDALGEWRELPALLSESDIVSLHLPLTPETESMVDKAAIERMKPGSILVNTARGGLVDQPALVEALQSRHLAAAGLDVFATEPLERDNPLLTLDNVFLSPHVAWLTQETLERSIVVAVENCRRLESGQDLLHQIL